MTNTTSNFIESQQDSSLILSESQLKLQEIEQRLQELDNLKTNFMRLLSHELRTPITVLLGYLEMLTESLEGRLESEDFEFLQISFQQANKLSKVIEQLTQFSRLNLSEIAQLPSAQEDNDLAHIVDTELDELRSPIQARNIELKIEMPDSLPCANIEPSRFKLVVQHLLSNALKFNSDNGWIQVTLRINEDTASEKDKTLELTCGNSGLSIPAEKVNAIFDSFQQAEEIKRRRFPGLGIGLTLVRQAVKSLAGQLEINSSTEGTFFTVKLPYRVWEDPAKLVQKLQQAESFSVAYAQDLRRIYNTERQERQHLIEANERLNTFAAKLLTVQEDERRRVSLELHDSVAQYVTFASQMLEAVEPEIAEIPVIDRAKQALRNARAEIRRVIADLRPPTLDQLGLIPALREYLNQMAVSNNWEVKLEHSDNLNDLNSSIEDTIFRVVQEALTNVRKHSDSFKVLVSLQSQNDSLQLIVKNWQKSKNEQVISRSQSANSANSANSEDEPDQHFGLIGMRERIELVKGTFSFDIMPAGAIVKAIIPLKA